MKIVFTPLAWQDYLWFQAQDRRLLTRINELIKDAIRSPFEGIGKPEPLRAICPVIGPDELTMSIAWFTPLREIS